MAAIDGTVNCASRDDTLGLLAGTAGCADGATATVTFSDSGLADFFSDEVSEVDKADISFFRGFTGRTGTALVLAADLTAALGATEVAEVLPEDALGVTTALELVLFWGADLEVVATAFLATAFFTTLATALGGVLDTADFDDLATGLTTALGANLTFASLREAGNGAFAALVLALLTGLVFTSGLLDGADCACSGSGTDNRLWFAARLFLATPLARRSWEAGASHDSESARDCSDLPRPKPMSCRSETIICFFVKCDEKQIDLRCQPSRPPSSANKRLLRHALLQSLQQNIGRKINSNEHHQIGR